MLEPKAKKQIIEICNRYKNEPTPLMMILSDIQKEYGYIPLEVQEVVSDQVNIPVSEIYGVVTFYTQFSIYPKGEYPMMKILALDDEELACSLFTRYLKDDKNLRRLLDILKLHIISVYLN